MHSINESEFSKFYTKYTSINTRLLRTVGLWPQDEGQKDSIARHALTIFYILILLSLTLTQFYHVYLIWGNFFDCLEILCNTTTSLLIVHKALTFYFKRNVISDFEKQSRKMWIAEFEDPSNRRMMIDEAKIGRELTYIFLSIVIFTVANFYLAPAVSVFYQWKSGTPSTEFVYILPYLVKLPLDLRQPVQHAIAYIPVTICSVSLIYYITGIDAFYCTAIQHLVLHLKLLQLSLTKLQTNEFKKSDETESPLDHLHSCIKKHDTIIKLESYVCIFLTIICILVFVSISDQVLFHRHSRVLEQIYSPIILGLGVISTLSMCMVIFHAVVTKGGHNGNVALFLMYLSMEVFEVLLYCWFGNALTFASSEVGLALYDTDWYDIQRDKKAFTSCICIMMIRTQRPIKLTAYKFADVSLRLFTSIMSTTASYFALLRTLYTS